MTTIKPLAVIPVALLLVSGCYNDKKSDDTTIATSESSVDTTVTTVATVATDSTDPTGSTPTTSPSIELDVVIGVDSGPDRLETVAVGSWIILTVTSPEADDEIHVHGVDLEQPVAAGESVTFTFFVDTVGEIEVESHVTDGVLIVIDVV